MQDLHSFPPFGALRHHLRHGVKRVTGFSGHCVPLQIQFPCHPAVRGHYNPPRSNHLISISRRKSTKICPSGEEAAAGGRRGAFPSPVRAVVWFSQPLATSYQPLAPLARQGGCTVLFILAPQAPTTALAPQARQTLEPSAPGLSNLGPKAVNPHP